MKGREGMKSAKWLKGAALVSGSLLALKKGHQFLKKRAPFKKLTVGEEKGAVPTLLIHGTNGTRRSLGGMIDRWDKRGVAYKALDVEISKSGKLRLTGNWQSFRTHKHPLVHVIFKEGDPPEWQQGAWVKDVLVLLRKQLGIEEVYLMGHSMGGVAGLRYIVDNSFDLSLPKVKKLVVVGAPFNGEVVHSSGRTLYDLGPKGPKNKDETYRYFHTYRTGIPASLAIFNVYGDLKNGSRSDGFVSVDSARSLKYLVKGKVVRYREHLVLGLKAQHSLLHENQQIDRLVAHFLWGTELDR